MLSGCGRFLSDSYHGSGCGRWPGQGTPAYVAGYRWGTDLALGQLRLLAEKVLGDEEHVGGALGEAAHEVGVPLAAEGRVDADVVALGDERALQIAADTKQHLKLEFAGCDVVRGGVGFGGGDHGGVVRCQAVVDAAGEQGAGEFDVVGVDVGLAREGDGGGLFVGAFAEADADAFGHEAVDVGLGAVEIGLDDDADVAAEARGGVDAVDDVEGDVGEGGVFHVDAEEAAGGLGVLGELEGDIFGQRGVEGEAHLGELDADVGVELAGLDEVEELVIDVGGGAGLGLGGDALAEGVKGDGHALAIDGGGDAESVFDFKAGDEAGAELVAEAGALTEAAQGTVAGESDKGGAKYGHQCFLPAGAQGNGRAAGKSSFAHGGGVGVAGRERRVAEVG